MRTYGAIFTILLLAAPALTQADDWSHTASIIATSGSDVYGKCVSATTRRSNSLTVDCELRKGGITQASLKHVIPTRVNAFSFTGELHASLQYQCVYCMRNDSKFDWWAPCIACNQATALKCASSGPPPGGPGGGRHDR